MSKWEQVLGVAFATIAACIGIWMVGDHFNLNKSEWASWVQAIGSIGAIIGAFEVGRRQIDSARRQAEESSKKATQARNQAIRAMVVHVMDEASAIYQALAAMPDFALVNMLKFNPYTFREMTAALAAIPLHELGSYDAVSALAGLQSNLKTIQVAIDKISAYQNAQPLQVPYQERVDLGAMCNLAKHNGERHLKLP